MRPSPTTLRWAIIAALLVLWEALPRIGAISPLFLPPLSETVSAVITDWPEYANALAVSLGEVAVALVFACGGGILAGAVIGSMPLLRSLLLPLASSLYAVPLVVLYPVLTVWLGIGSESKIAFAAINGFLPTALATAAGIRTIDPNLLLAARSMGAMLSQRVTRVIIPASIPTVLAGLRLGGVLVIVSVVVAEMLTSTAGIGYIVTRYRTVLDSAHVFGAVLLIVLVTLLFDTFARFLERRSAAWQPQAQRGPSRTLRGDRRTATGAVVPAE
jgi:NitT/TauT family transport system permease protein